MPSRSSDSSPSGEARDARARARRRARPNLVLVTLDTVRADHLGCYGDSQAITPALDGLAAEGLRFTSASSTVPLTLPSHTTILSGLLPPHHGLRNNGAGLLAPGTPTLATLLAAAGYRTAAFLGAFVLDHRFGLAGGFEVYDDEIPRDPRAGTILEAERQGRDVMDRALAWLRTPAKDDARPFFVWVHLYDAHAPYQPPAQWAARHPGRPYDGEISEVDEQVGRLLAELKSRGLDGRTVVAVAADHGEGLGEHGELTHGLLLYEPTLHVPLLLRAPWGLKPRVVAAPVSLVDLAPTLAGLVGHPFPAGRDGRDLSQALLAGEEPAPGNVYAETRYPATFGWSPLAALRRRDRKYIASPRPELYDLARDPGEVTNLLASAPAAETSGFASGIAAIEAGAVTAPRSGDSKADAETRRRLASLGYVAGNAPAGSPGDRPRRWRRPGRGTRPIPRRWSSCSSASSGRTRGSTPGTPPARQRSWRRWWPPIPPTRSSAASWRRPGASRASSAAPSPSTGRPPPTPRTTPRPGTTWRRRCASPGRSRRRGRRWSAPSRSTRGCRTPTTRWGSSTSGTASWRRPSTSSRPPPASIPGTRRRSTTSATCCAAEEKPADAERAYQRAVAVAPTYAEPLNGLGTLAVDRDRPQEALPYFERALALAPGYHEVRLNQAIAHEHGGRCR